MKHTAQQPDIMKRKLLALLAGLPVLVACAASPRQKAYEKHIAGEIAAMSPEDKNLRERFHGIYGGVLKFDATSPKHG